MGCVAGVEDVTGVAGVTGFAGFACVGEVAGSIHTE
jgi:hypothetical protein